MGSDLNDKELKDFEIAADRKMGILDALLTSDEVTFLENIGSKHSQLPITTSKNRYEAFLSLFTHDSTAIEGNTLTLQETASLLFENIAPIKDMREIHEVLNHKKAFDYVLAYKGDITKKFICELHRLVMLETLDKEINDQIGKYRTLQVYIRGVDWVPAPPENVASDMKTLLTWYSKNKNKLHPLVTAIYFHVGFEIIHPFVDGNGRIGRLLMNFILHKNSYPMVNIPNERRNTYYFVLREAQIKGNLRPFIEFVIKLYKNSKVMF